MPTFCANRVFLCFSISIVIAEIVHQSIKLEKKLPNIFEKQTMILQKQLNLGHALPKFVISGSLSKSVK